ncbi:hypothetical protein TNCV_1110261 [Trichonephila clavipes]|nr:hypothetical protein TNCV_1110261 [Trichonephila clavipes]
MPYSEFEPEAALLQSEGHIHYTGRAATEWIKKLNEICLGYEIKNITDADEIRLFCRILSDKTICLKGEKYSGGKGSRTVKAHDISFDKKITWKAGNKTKKSRKSSVPKTTPMP